MRLLTLWFGLSAPVSRRAYAASGFSLMLFKYAVEALAIHSVTGLWMSPLVYLSPLISQRLSLLGTHESLIWALALWTLPFLWIGVSMTVRRAEDAGLGPVPGAMFFVPILNYALMLALCLLPSRPRAGNEARTPRPILQSAARSALLGAGLG